MRAARLVFVGDLHLGRRPSRLPEDLADFGLQAAELGPTAVWNRTVSFAIAENADAVVLAGDVVDRLDDRFEAYAHLEAGVRRLLENGIRVLAVVGNHDVEALPRLADLIPDFELLGRGGVWQAVDLTGDEHVPVRLIGWSFPKQRVAESPCDTLPSDLASRNGVTLGVLHCDLDASGSSYAPVRRKQLEDAPVDAWLLGHIHKPSDLSAARPIGYLGSMVGLDPGEPGERGPWWVEVEGPGAVSARHVPLAPLRYQQIDCSLEGLGGMDSAAIEDEFFRRLGEAFQSVLPSIDAATEGGILPPRLVACRVRVQGHERHQEAVRRAIFDEHRWSHPQVLGGTICFVERIVEDAEPDLNLAELAGRADPPGVLARRLIGLRDGTDEARDLLERSRDRLLEATRRSTWQALEPPAWQVGDHDLESLREIMLRAGTRELEGLIAQRDRRSVGFEASK